MDDGESNAYLTDQMSLKINMSFESGVLSSQATEKSEFRTDMQVKKITIFGLSESPREATAMVKTIPFSYAENTLEVEGNFELNFGVLLELIF